MNECSHESEEVKSPQKTLPNRFNIPVAPDTKRGNSINEEIDPKSDTYSKSSVEIEVRKMKKNGLNWPFHPAQVLSWIFYAINLISYYLIILPCLSSISHIGMAILSMLYLILNLAVLFYALRAMSSNPTDREVLLSRELMKKGITPEKGDLKLYCEVCESYVNERTKHCGQCNR